MASAPMPKPLQDLAGLFLLMMVAGGIALGWVRNRGLLNGGDGTSGDGSDSDDGQHAYGSWNIGDSDGGHHSDSEDG